jgi:hypothetical protein
MHWRICSRVCIRRLDEQEGAQSGDSDLSQFRLDIKNVVSAEAAKAGITLVSRPVEDANAAMAALQALGPDEADAIFILKEATLRHAGPELKRVAWRQKLSSAGGVKRRPTVQLEILTQKI